MIVGSGASALRILFVVRSLGLGGAELQLAHIARGLHQRGHVVQVAALYAGGTVWDRLPQAGIACVHLDKRSRWNVWSPLQKLIDVAHGFRPDVVYSFMPAANVMAAVARSRLRPAALVWGVRSSRADFGFYGAFPALLTRVEGRLSSKPDLIICNSHAGRHYYSRVGWNSRRMTVVENGFDLAELYPDAAGRDRLREELAVPADRCVVGIVGRIDPIKDHASFLHMAAAVSSQRPECEFWCVGGGNERYVGKLQSLAQRLGVAARVRWLGARQDMRAVYSAMDVTCMTSLAEGFPNVVGESMACGTPCVAFDVGDAATIVGDRGLVAATRSPEQLATAVLSALAGSNALRSRVRERIASSFSLARCVERSEECLSKVAGKLVA